MIQKCIYSPKDTDPRLHAEQHGTGVSLLLQCICLCMYVHMRMPLGTIPGGTLASKHKLHTCESKVLYIPASSCNVLYNTLSCIVSFLRRYFASISLPYRILPRSTLLSMLFVLIVLNRAVRTIFLMALRLLQAV